MYDIYNGNWSPLNPIDDVWGNYYTAIRAANSFLENYSLEKLERFQWNPNYKENMEKAKMYVNEVRALRAFYYLELAKRYGDIPLLTRTYGIDEINTVSETPFDKVIEFIAQECSEVAPALPVSQKEFYNESGRVTRGMALSVKARALLYAASKLHNPSGEKSKWEKAAEAAYDIIKENWYSLPNIDVDPLYNVNGGNDVLSSSQLIFERRNGASNSFEGLNLPIGFENGNSGSTPTQNLVDAFEMSDGQPFDWNNPKHSARPYVRPAFLQNGSLQRKFIHEYPHRDSRGRQKRRSSQWRYTDRILLEEKHERNGLTLSDRTGDQASPFHLIPLCGNIAELCRSHE